MDLARPRSSSSIPTWLKVWRSRRLVSASRFPLSQSLGSKLRADCSAPSSSTPRPVLYKPLRSTGIYSALFFATNEHRRRHDVAQELQLLEGRHRSRRFVTRAIVHLMRDRGIDDEEAFRLLRKESMRRRLTIEEYAVQLAARPREAMKKAREA